MSAHDYLVHKLSEFMAVHEQPKGMNNVTVHKQNSHELRCSCTYMNIS